MTYAARIAALPLPEPSAHEVLAYGRRQKLVTRADVAEASASQYRENAPDATFSGLYSASQVRAIFMAATEIAAAADTELTALRARVGELERALTDLLASDRANQSEIVGRDVDGHPLNASGVARLQALAAINKEKL